MGSKADKEAKEKEEALQERLKGIWLKNVAKDKEARAKAGKSDKKK